MSDIAILVIDDDPDHVELIVSALEDRCDRSRIATAASGADALEFLNAQGAHAHRDARKQPRLIVLDLRMQPTDGIEVLKAVRANPLTGGIPVVMLSGTSDRAELDRCYEAGANSVVRKSTDFEELRQKMVRVYDFWITVNEANRNSRV